MIQGLAGVLAKELLETAKAQYIEQLKRTFLANELNKKRSEFLQNTAEKYAEEVKENISSYIEAVGEMEAEVEYRGRPGEAFVNRAEMAIKGLEEYLQKQNPDGPVINYLKQRYHEEGINIITGNLYGGHLVNTRGIGTVEIMNKMGYAAAVDRTKPWLTGKETEDGLQEVIMEAVLDLFDQAFDDIDLSDDLALMKNQLIPKVKNPGIGSAQKGTIYINDGKENRRILPSQEIPKGWKKGRVKNWA